MGGTFSSSSSNNEAALTLDSISQGLANGQFKNVVVMCGAGISTSAGVPDFRSPSASLYYKLKTMPGLPYPEAVFDSGFFRTNPKPFYELVRNIYPQRLCPTDTHKLFQLLDTKGILKRVYTQNIDALESLAGLDQEKLVHAHGTFLNAYCVSCKRSYDLAWLKAAIFDPTSNEGVPKCASCGAVVRPDVVLFGEELPSRFWQLSRRDFEDCDLLLVFGTSLSVAPFNGLVGRTKKPVPRVYVNRTKPGGSGGFLAWIMGLSANISFDKSTDLIVRDGCDKTTRSICQKAGWIDELDNLPVDIMEA